MLFIQYKASSATKKEGATLRVRVRVRVGVGVRVRVRVTISSQIY